MKKENLLIFIISAFLAIFALFILRDIKQIPMHYSISGDVNSYGSKYILVLFAFLPFLIAILMDVLKKIDPNQENYEMFIRYYKYLKYLLVAFFNAFFVIILISNIFTIDVVMWINLLISILFIIIGFILPNIKQNYFVGIKTPWTLKDEETWDKTHHRGKYVFIAMGVVFLVLAFVRQQFIAILGIVTIIVLIVYLLYYSYSVYNKLRTK